MTHELPQKSTFRVSEITELCGVKPYVLRYWETQFDGLKPSSTSSGQKLYDREQLEKILTIRDLLSSEKLSIEEAKDRLGQALVSTQKDYLSDNLKSSIEERLTSCLDLIQEKRRKFKW